MALESAKVTFKKATSLQVGEKIVGYVTGFYNSSMYPETNNLEMVSLEGEKFILSVAGNLKYFKANGFKTNIYWEFTRLPDTLNKKGQKTSAFDMFRDLERPYLPKDAPTPPPTPPSPTPAGQPTAADNIPF